MVLSGRAIAQRIKGTPGIQADTAQELISTAVSGTSMSAHHILGLEQVPRFGCSPIKVVRELGSERRETVRSLSAMRVEN